MKSTKREILKLSNGQTMPAFKFDSDIKLDISADNLKEKLTATCRSSFFVKVRTSEESAKVAELEKKVVIDWKRYGDDLDAARDARSDAIKKAREEFKPYKCLDSIAPKWVYADYLHGVEATAEKYGENYHLFNEAFASIRGKAGNQSIETAYGYVPYGRFSQDCLAYLAQHILSKEEITECKTMEFCDFQAAYMSKSSK